MTTQPVLTNLLSLNHLSLICNDVTETKRFYKSLLGYQEVARPTSFNFDGSWLFGYGIGLHLIKGQPCKRARGINPRDDHISFVAADLDDIEWRLNKQGIRTVKQTVQEAGITVTQVFFHDPDHNMIEICNCNTLPIIPLTALESEAGWSPAVPSKRLTTSRPGEVDDNWMAIWSEMNYGGATADSDSGQLSRSSCASDRSEVMATEATTQPLSAMSL